MLVFEILQGILLEVCLECCVGLVTEFAVTDDGFILRPRSMALSQYGSVLCYLQGISIPDERQALDKAVHAGHVYSASA